MESGLPSACRIRRFAYWLRVAMWIMLHRVTNFEQQGKQGMPNSLGGKRILVLEDEALVAMVLEDMLADLGMSVVGPAATIEEALKLVEMESCDAAILDMNVDGADSLPVADALAARGLPYAFASGMPDPPIGLHANAPLMPKPYRDVDLQQLLNRFFQ